MSKLSKINIFKKELAELLKKHEACINVTFDECSDFQGVYGEKVVVDFKGDRNEYTLVDHSVSVDYSDLKGC